MALVRDPAFWKRFSAAIHLDEEAKAGTDQRKPSIWSDTWIQSQRQKKRRTFICGFLIFLIIALFAAAIVVVILWLKSRNWLQTLPDQSDQI
ncbi:hypothetical protein BO94DRAFT_626675 [Aspergillus sclerotioniger CBS 115572]|uniref:Uncharacterized protein n=1 Tax=Aspergillus sclerotioniger CBS 115572 TaxID=1450535 RepID=A0A317VYU2_9EURO|nr:hypothetical protein BO94DRAFT_626675 [Aspergillus sclerotioniger CBS 115572]PWY78088.1 hypothetical protein BO94DRAFT_626675 [Aspergillus sclerotioniger CBS 115572]